MFLPTDNLEFEDFCLLEEFQVKYLPGWIPEREFAVALWAHSPVEQFLKRKCPSISDFVNRIKRENEPAKTKAIWLFASRKSLKRAPIF